jgi:hypothetical protein
MVHRDPEGAADRGAELRADVAAALVATGRRVRRARRSVAPRQLRAWVRTNAPAQRDAACLGDGRCRSAT